MFFHLHFKIYIVLRLYSLRVFCFDSAASRVINGITDDDVDDDEAAADVYSVVATKLAK